MSAAWISASAPGNLEPPVGVQDDEVGVAHGTGSTTQSKAAEPVSGTLGWCQHSTGNDTWII